MPAAASCATPPVPKNRKRSNARSKTRTTRYPFYSAAVAQFLGFCNWLILEVRVSSLDGARDPIDLVAATVDAFGLVEHAIFGEDFVDGRAPTRGVVFTEDILKIAGEQGRYAIVHGVSRDR